MLTSERDSRNRLGQRRLYFVPEASSNALAAIGACRANNISDGNRSSGIKIAGHPDDFMQVIFAGHAIAGSSPAAGRSLLVPEGFLLSLLHGSACFGYQLAFGQGAGFFAPRTLCAREGSARSPPDGCCRARAKPAPDNLSASPPCIRDADMSGTETRSDPFGLGMKAFARGVARSSCPFPSSFFEGRNWFRGWDYGRSRAAARQFRVGQEEGA